MEFGTRDTECTTNCANGQISRLARLFSVGVEVNLNTLPGTKTGLSGRQQFEVVKYSSVTVLNSNPLGMFTGKSGEMEDML
ncbi:MAG: hypothetical protein Kow0088_07860 [Anaerolineales bacterium]